MRSRTGELSQALALMHLFLRLKDAGARERCLSFVRDEVNAET